MFVKEHNSQRITLEGAVAKPGVIPMAGSISLLQAVAEAGGFTATAEKTAVVFRMVDGKRLAGKYDVSDIRAGKSEDPQLQSGDIVVVPRRAGGSRNARQVPAPRGDRAVCLSA